MKHLTDDTIAIILMMAIFLSFTAVVIISESTNDAIRFQQYICKTSTDKNFYYLNGQRNAIAWSCDAR